VTVRYLVVEGLHNKRPLQGQYIPLIISVVMID
ncbi:hypothetical protein M2478_001899, partial [Breznakia sp. PFB2-8]|nr:hypothetical protein [Breznakia sp. PFB2-8]